MTSKQDILAKIRRNLPPAAELPEVDEGPWLHYEDRLEQFRSVLQAVGGHCVVATGATEVNDYLRQLPAYAEAGQIASLVPGIGQPTVEPNSLHDPHDLADLDFAILEGQFGVAENGAVWVPGGPLRHRVICFIPQHLALVIRTPDQPADALVDNMHEAYQRLSFADAVFGLFMSGPSKTADIEQSLVIGAQGPRSLTVFLMRAPAA